MVLSWFRCGSIRRGGLSLVCDNDVTSQECVAITSRRERKKSLGIHGAEVDCPLCVPMELLSVLAIREHRRRPEPVGRETLAVTIYRALSDSNRVLAWKPNDFIL
jgi:hypothetical protein